MSWTMLALCWLLMAALVLEIAGATPLTDIIDAATAACADDGRCAARFLLHGDTVATSYAITDFFAAHGINNELAIVMLALNNTELLVTMLTEMPLDCIAVSDVVETKMSTYYLQAIMFGLFLFFLGFVYFFLRIIHKLDSLLSKQQCDDSPDDVARAHTFADSMEAIGGQAPNYYQSEYTGTAYRPTGRQQGAPAHPFRLQLDGT